MTNPLQSESFLTRALAWSLAFLAFMLIVALGFYALTPDADKPAFLSWVFTSLRAALSGLPGVFAAAYAALAVKKAEAAARNASIVRSDVASIKTTVENGNGSH